MKLKRKEKLILKQFKKLLEKKFGNNLVDVKLFGSKARGKSRKDSDIDILVIILNGDWRMSDIVYEIATDLFLETGICISPKVINQKQYNHLCNIGNDFILNVISDGITL